MKKILLCFLVILSTGVHAQLTSNNPMQCNSAISICEALGEPFPNAVHTGNASPGVDYGCLSSTNNPIWFYLAVSQDGLLQFTISQTNTLEEPLDVDFICYGPFSSINDGCENAGIFTEVDCSYSSASTEELSMGWVEAGEYYLLMVTNLLNIPGYITITPSPVSTPDIIACDGLAAESFSSGGFTMYPNPADLNVTFTITDNSLAISSVVLYDTMGKILYTQNNLAHTSYTLDLSAFSAGSYFIEITDTSDSKMVRQLLIK